MTCTLGSLRGTSAYADLKVRCQNNFVVFSPTPDLSEGGSGTLVQYKGIYGILSATHVMADSMDSSGIFSPLLPTANPTLFFTSRITIKNILHLETAHGIQALQKTKWPSGA